MPCHGVSVTSAQVTMDLGAFFSDVRNQDALTAYLEGQGLHTRRWWHMARGGWSVAISTLYAGVGFSGSDISIEDEGPYENFKEPIDRAYGLSYLFVGQQIQANIIKTLADAGLNPRDLKQLEGGTVEVRSDLSPTPAQVNTLLKETVRVQISLDGSTRLITENGTVEVGKKKLEIFMALLGQRSGMTVTPSGEFETHRHDEAMERQQIQW